MNPTPTRIADNHDLAVYEEKPGTDHVETASVVDVDEKAVNPKADYSGFVQKTDPKEIKLVRKLDLYIMVNTSVVYPLIGPTTDMQTSLWAMYWLNYLDRNAIALAKCEPSRSSYAPAVLTLQCRPSKTTSVYPMSNTKPAYQFSLSDMSSPVSRPTCSSPESRSQPFSWRS
jgi:hypothetical protein